MCATVPKTAQMLQERQTFVVVVLVQFVRSGQENYWCSSLYTFVHITYIT